MKGFDRWITDGRYHDTLIECTCPNGHTWHAPAYSEYGATYFHDEERGPVCPAPGCDAYAIDEYDDEAPTTRPSDDGIKPVEGYEVQSDGSYMIPEPEPDYYPSDEEYEAMIREDEALVEAHMDGLEVI